MPTVCRMSGVACQTNIVGLPMTTTAVCPGIRRRIVRNGDQIIRRGLKLRFCLDSGLCPAQPPYNQNSVQRRQDDPEFCHGAQGVSLAPGNSVISALKAHVAPPWTTSFAVGCIHQAAYRQQHPKAMWLSEYHRDGGVSARWPQGRSAAGAARTPPPQGRCRMKHHHQKAPIRMNRVFRIRQEHGCNVTRRTPRFFYPVWRAVIGMCCHRRFGYFRPIDRLFRRSLLSKRYRVPAGSFRHCSISTGVKKTSNEQKTPVRHTTRFTYGPFFLIWAVKLIEEKSRYIKSRCMTIDNYAERIRPGRFNF